MDRYQLALYFVGGFLLSRAMIATRLADSLALALVQGRADLRQSVGLTAITVRLVAFAAMLSFLVPNAVTVLTLLPVVARLRQALVGWAPLREQRRLATLLALAVIYGANIGGMGSITATPANGIFVAFLEARKVPGREAVNFLSWLGWGIPLVAALTALASLLLLLVFRPWRLRVNALELDWQVAPGHHPRRVVTLLMVGYGVGALLLSWAMLKLSSQELVLAATAALTLALSGLLFFYRSGEGAARRPLLTLRECTNELPTRGFVLMAVAVALAGGIYLLGWYRPLVASLVARLPGPDSPFALALAMALIASFATELLSNTAVQLALLAMLQPMPLSLPGATITLGKVVTLSSTCAFMSPIATGVNGLAFGGIKGASLWRMLAVGFLMNVLAALAISFVTLAFSA
jgi:sodium-dependent dicarboxylate transporter 2/3/5